MKLRNSSLFLLKFAITVFLLVTPLALYHNFVSYSDESLFAIQIGTSLAFAALVFSAITFVWSWRLAQN